LGANVVVELNSESRHCQPSTRVRGIIRRADRAHRLANHRISGLECIRKSRPLLLGPDARRRTGRETRRDRLTARPRRRASSKLGSAVVHEGGVATTKCGREDA